MPGAVRSRTSVSSGCSASIGGTRTLLASACWHLQCLKMTGDCLVGGWFGFIDAFLTLATTALVAGYTHDFTLIHSRFGWLALAAVVVEFAVIVDHFEIAAV